MKTAAEVIEQLSSRQEVEDVAENGPNETVRGWAPHLTDVEIRNAARAYLANLTDREPM